MLKLAYNTNGLQSHRLLDAIHILAEIGYRGVSITLDVVHLDPFDTTPGELKVLRRELERRGLEVAIETGGRYVLDPWHKHHPTLLSEIGRDRRLEFLLRAVDIASELEAGVVSFWSGKPDPVCTGAEAYHRLAEGIRKLAGHAEKRGVTLAFEPEPGMLVEGLADFRRLESFLEGVDLPLTLDVGHLLLTETEAPDAVIRSVGNQIANVHIEDMKRGVHEHLPFGEGDLDFPPVLRALQDLQYEGLLSVELSRESHRGGAAARDAYEFLSRRL